MRIFNFRKKKQRAPRTLLNTVIEDFKSALQQTDTRNPSPKIWQKVLSALSQVRATGISTERVLYMRARAYYYSGMYKETITDLDELIKLDTYGNSIVVQLPPKRLRAMANIKLGRFFNAEEDLRDLIESLKQGLTHIHGGTAIIQRSDDYYWLLVCKHRGDERAASDEQSELFDKLNGK